MLPPPPDPEELLIASVASETHGFKLSIMLSNALFNVGASILVLSNLILLIVFFFNVKAVYLT